MFGKATMERLFSSREMLKLKSSGLLRCLARSLSGREDYHWHTGDKPAVLGFPFAGGQTKEGVEKTPELLRDMYPDRFETLFWKDVDISREDRKCNAGMPMNEYNMKNFPTTMKCNRMLFEEKMALGPKQKILVIGGDHSLSIGSIGASLAMHKKLQVIWINAHPDLTRPEDSKIGDMHEMSGAFLTGSTALPHRLHIHCEFIPRSIPIDRIHHFGLRKFWAHELSEFDKHKIHFTTVEHINTAQREANFKSLCELVHPEAPTHVSFDVGVIDPKEFPGTGTPVKDGLRFSRAKKLLRYVLGEFNVVAVDLAEANLVIGDKEDREKSRKALGEIFDVILDY